MENIKVDNNGTKYYQDSNTLELFFCCQYCSSWFQTKRKFNQKFCSNSCRTLESKEKNKENLKNKNDKNIEELIIRIEQLEKNNKLLYNVLKDTMLQLHFRYMNNVDNVEKNAEKDRIVPLIKNLIHGFK